jgi:PleD family two-component response regulator
MIANCPNCAMSLSFEDDRLPTEPFNVMCPRCRQSVTIMPPPKEEPKLPGTAQRMEALTTGTHQAYTADPLRSLAELLVANLKKQDTTSEASPLDRRRVLVCLDDAQMREKLRAALNPKHYEMFSSNSAPEAIEGFIESRIEVIVLSPSFDAANQGTTAIMQYVNNLSPQARRRTYVVLLSSQLRTLDTYLAFANGVNLTLHPDDIGSFQAIFERSLRDYNQLYRPFNAAAGTQAF